MSEEALASWRGVRAEVLRRISARIWRPGDLIPAEAALAAELGCARSTVNRALRDLAAAGLLDRRRRAGTRVAREPVRRATVEIPILRREVEATGARYRHAVLARRETPAPAPIAARLGLEAGTALLALETLHLADNRPWAHERRWVNPAAAPGIREADLAATSANEWLVHHAPYTACDLVFSAENATPEEAALLEAAPDAALFVTERTTWMAGTGITHVRLAAPPGYRMRTRL
ncbi:MAG: GntR family transcriptional regulator [Pseudomonadota bacterium]